VVYKIHRRNPHQKFKTSFGEFKECCKSSCTSGKNQVSGNLCGENSLDSKKVNFFSLRHDKKLLYLVNTPQCPVPVSVRLPTNSCTRGCFFCCRNSWKGNKKYALKAQLTREDFLRLWKQIIIDNNFRYVWPQKKILNALKKQRVLRFVREELFDPTLDDITEDVLWGCYIREYGLLVKTSSMNITKYISQLSILKHCIVFSITDLLIDFREKVRCVNTLVGAGLKVTLSLSPIFEFNETTKYILSRIDRKILGVEVGWLHGSPSWIPKEYLNKPDYKVIHSERQYKISHLKGVVELIKSFNFPVRFYFRSHFFSGGACCFCDKIF